MRIERPGISVSPILCLPVNTEILVYRETETGQEVFELRCAYECQRLWVTIKAESIGPARDKDTEWLKVVESEKAST